MIALTFLAAAAVHPFRLAVDWALFDTGRTIAAADQRDR
jgi:hypothetical protein